MNTLSSSTIAFVTGYVGPRKTRNIPKKPLGYDGYFITNNKTMYKRIKKTDWTPIFVEDTYTLLSKLPENHEFKSYQLQDIATLNKDTQFRFHTMTCKALKVFPQEFLPHGNYDFLIWFDNKFNINQKGTLETLQQWNPQHAVMFHRHTFVENIDNEFKESMLQERYVEEKEHYLQYIDEQKNEGFSSQHHIHYQCGYIIYNMKHPKTPIIQNTWQEHIGKCGINDQISFNFVAQRFEEFVGEYLYDIDEKKEDTFLKRLSKVFKS